jgi:ABC-type glycerol-3-phosphate transport system substrate-binding protein
LPAFSDPVFDEPDPYYGGQPVGRIVLNGLMKIHNKVEWHTGPVDSGQMSSEIMGPELRKLMTGEELPQEALDNALAKIREQLGQ